jgi:hypothetical protein
MDIWKLDLRLELLASVYAFATLESGAHGDLLSLVLDCGWPISLTALSRPQYVVANLTRRVCIRGAWELRRATEGGKPLKTTLSAVTSWESSECPSIYLASVLVSHDTLACDLERYTGLEEPLPANLLRQPLPWFDNAYSALS